MGANPVDNMSFMKSLTLTIVPKIDNDPIRSRRERLIARLLEQKELISNPALVRTIHRTVKKDGVRTVVETQQKVHPCWRMDEKGQVVLFVRLGWKLLEFEEGKTGIVAGSMERLPVVIDTLIEAVRAGELDPALEQAKAARPAPKKKAA
jgi:hypothetical protein